MKCAFVIYYEEGKWNWSCYYGDPREPDTVGEIGGCYGHDNAEHAMSCALGWLEIKAPEDFRLKVSPVQGEC